MLQCRNGIQCVYMTNTLSSTAHANFSTSLVQTTLRTHPEDATCQANSPYCHSMSPTPYLSCPPGARDRPNPIQSLISYTTLLCTIARGGLFKSPKMLAAGEPGGGATAMCLSLQ
jgi:hypothetical protein